MVTLDKVTKRYRTRIAVNDISFQLKRGELFGLLGPNGAGKTTTVSMIAGALRPDSGKIEIDGFGAPGSARAKRSLGIVPQTVALYEMLSAQENLKFFGGLYGFNNMDLKSRINEVLEIVNLSDRRKERVRKFSGGMKRRLNIAAALLHRPALLLLDEPTVGVDPQSRNAIFETLQAIKSEGCTIILTSHYIEEVQKLCDRVGIMDEGKLVAEDTVSKLITNFGGKSVLTIETDHGKTKIETDEPVKEIVRINALDNIISLHLESPSLEKAFLNITGKHLRD